MACGMLKSRREHPNAAACVYEGRLRLWTLAAPIKLTPTGVAADTRDHTHEVAVRAPHGDWVDAGRAWTRTISKGPNEGRVMLSISFDLPDALERKLNLAAFPMQGDPEMWEMRAERPRQATPDTSADRGAPTSSDDIPY